MFDKKVESLIIHQALRHQMKAIKKYSINDAESSLQYLIRIATRNMRK